MSTAINCVSGIHTVQSVCSVALCPMLFSKILLSVGSVNMTTAIYSLSTVCQYLTLWRYLFCVSVTPGVFYSLSNVCQYATLYHPLILCHWCFLQTVQSPLVPQIVPSVLSVSLYPTLTATACTLQVSTSHCIVYWFFFTSVHCYFLRSLHSQSVPQNLPSVGSLTLYPFLLLYYLHCLSVPHNVTSVGSVSLCPLQFSANWPLCIITAYCTVCWYLTLHRLFVLFHCAHCYLLQTFDSQSEPHPLLSVGSLSPYPLVFYSISTVCQYLTL